MIHIVVALLVYILVLTTHVLMHRVTFLKKSVFNKLVLLYGLGVTGVFVFTSSPFARVYTTFPDWGGVMHLSFPVSAVFVYVSLSFLTVYEYLGIKYGEIIPTSVILEMLQKPRTFDQLTQQFYEDTLVAPRIQALCDAGLIKRKKTTVHATRVGVGIVTVFRLYSFVFGREVGG